MLHSYIQYTAGPYVFIEYRQDQTKSSGGTRKQRIYVILSVTISPSNVGPVHGFPNGLGIPWGELIPSVHILLEVLLFFFFAVSAKIIGQSGLDAERTGSLVIPGIGMMFFPCAGDHVRAICPAVALYFLPILDVSVNLNRRPMRVFLYIKHSASSPDPLEASDEDANLIRTEKSLPFFSFQVLLVSCRGCCTGPMGGVRTAIEESWWGSVPVNLSLGLRHVTFEQKQPQGAGVHSVELPIGMSTRSMERRGRNLYVNIAEVVASLRWLLDHSMVRLCRDLELDFYFTSRRRSCVAGPSIRFCVSWDDRSSGHSIQC